mmetsp:Transcript_3429/g.5014  ORF Transcript_3429/g.5014 Transcript_3429/m.5014 type:complete len:211 (+) Transcript_3429:170-802(+)
MRIRRSLRIHPRPVPLRIGVVSRFRIGPQQGLHNGHRRPRGTGQMERQQPQGVLVRAGVPVSLNEGLDNPDTQITTLTGQMEGCHIKILTSESQRKGVYINQFLDNTRWCLVFTGVMYRKIPEVLVFGPDRSFFRIPLEPFSSVIPFSLANVEGRGVALGVVNIPGLPTQPPAFKLGLDFLKPGVGRVNVIPGDHPAAVAYVGRIGEDAQ